MRSEAEFQRLKAASETRARALENLEPEPGDAVRYNGETWLFLEVRKRDSMVVLEQWDRMKTVSPTGVSAK